jgi:hypothetical protein
MGSAHSEPEREQPQYSFRLGDTVAYGQQRWVYIGIAAGKPDEAVLSSLGTPEIRRTAPLADLRLTNAPKIGEMGTLSGKSARSEPGTAQSRYSFRIGDTVVYEQQRWVYIGRAARKPGEAVLSPLGTPEIRRTAPLADLRLPAPLND